MYDMNMKCPPPAYGLEGGTHCGVTLASIWQMRIGSGASLEEVGPWDNPEMCLQLLSVSLFLATLSHLVLPYPATVKLNFIASETKQWGLSTRDWIDPLILWAKMSLCCLNLF